MDQFRLLFAHQRMTVGPTEHNRRTTMKIGEFRVAVDSLNWNRRDLSGATRQEFVAMDVRTRLERHIVIVSGLLPLVHTRFADDLAHAISAIESAQATIVRWEGYRAQA